MQYVPSRECRLALFPLDKLETPATGIPFGPKASSEARCIPGRYHIRPPLPLRGAVSETLCLCLFPFPPSSSPPFAGSGF
jgi:hypothetical protein